LPHVPYRPRIDKSYTKTPYASDPVFTKIPSRGDYLWQDYYTSDGTNKIYLTEIIDPRGLLVMSWTRADDRKIIYKYSVKMPAKLNKAGKISDPY